ncbi:MAG TPA: flagellar biosynthesis protein FlhA [Fimbriimonas sp.]|nr:flagellar biosynthesis protein FlhA [Fimbriimonas sp.]
MQKLLRHTDLLVGFGLLGIVAMLMLPLPQWALDIGLVGAMASAVIILLMAVNVQDPLQFSAFPSILLITTLGRLALSIAATKLILGTGQAGHVIGTFGDFVMGGDPVVGFVAFLILVIVQFVVITNGAGRVSEVVARFTLDSMPGKQMAIDADLAAGLIDENMARERRKHIKREADFYGSMDGASKFVKGDAIAAILIIAVNIIAGFVVGFMRGSTDAMTILKQYTILSVGEGLVSQMPALLISTASGLMVTRAGQDRSMGGEVAAQIFNQPKAIGVAGIALAAFAFVPGFPATIFLGAAGICFGLYRFLQKTPEVGKLFETQTQQQEKALASKQQQAPAPTGPEAVLPLLSVDPIEIEIGYALTKLADTRLGGDLPDRVTATRRQIALEMGFVMPTVRIRDSVHLEPNEYCIKVRGEEVAKAICMAQNLLAVSNGSSLQSVPGTSAKDPVFNLDAVWIETHLRDNAERAGYTVIEPAAVISTHLAEIVRQYAAELLTRQDVQTLIDNAKGADDTVVQELIPSVFQVGDVQKVLQHLLRERVPIRDMVTILETMADYGAKIKDPEQLGEIVRAAIARTVTRQYVDHENKLACITLEPVVERELVECLHVSSQGTTLVMDQAMQNRFIERLQREADTATGQGYQAVLICSTQLRLPLRRLLERHIPTLHVLAYNEIAAKADVEFVGQVRAA